MNTRRPSSLNEPEHSFLSAIELDPLVHRVHHSQASVTFVCRPHQLSMSPDRSYITPTLQRARLLVRRPHHLRTSPTTYAIVNDAMARPPPPIKMTRTTPPPYQRRQRRGNTTGTSVSRQSVTKMLFHAGIRANDIDIGLGRIPVGFYVIVEAGALQWRTRNEPIPVRP